MTEQEKIEALARAIYPSAFMERSLNQETARVHAEITIFNLFEAGFDIVRRPARILDPNTPARCG